MANLHYKISVPFDQPTVYQIDVQGNIDSNWSDCLAGMQIRIAKEQTNPIATTSEGEISDQAALLGALNSLSELELPTRSVVVLPEVPGKKE
jgi:hypothetical protein